MIGIHKTYHTLLRAALWGRTEERLVIGDEQELTAIIKLAAFQGTEPLVYDQLLKMPDMEIPAELRMQMKQQCMMSLKQQQMMMPILSKAWNALEEADIHPVLLKGLALAQYYPQPYLRQWGDIDLYVGQAQYHQACKILNDVFPEADHPAIDDEERKHYNYVFPNTVLELHRISMGFAHPRDRKYYEKLEEAYLTKDGPSFECNGIAVTTPEDTFNVFFTFLHAWHHLIETGMNMKQLCDVAILLQAQREVIDRERLHAMLVRLYLLDVWQLFMYIMVNYLGLSKEVCPFYTDVCQERAKLLFDRVLTEGSSRKAASGELQAASRMSFLKRKWITFQSRMADSRLVRPYAPEYARHMVRSAIVHGSERLVNGK